MYPRLIDSRPIQASNKSDMGFHIDVHSNVTHCQTPVNTCASSSSENNAHSGSESIKFTDNDRKQVNSQTRPGKHVKKEWVLSKHADKYNLELRFKPRHRQKIESAKK